MLIYRNFLNFIEYYSKGFYIFLDNNDHKDLYDKFKPSLVIVGSMGLDADGLVLAESKKIKLLH